MDERFGFMKLSLQTLCVSGKRNLDACVWAGYSLSILSDGAARMDGFRATQFMISIKAKIRTAGVIT
jgi:hypothetical protein